MRQTPRTAGSMRPVVLALAVTAMAFLDARAVRAQWDEPIDWLIPCTAAIEAEYGADHALCADSYYEGGLKTTLDAASRWLEGLGFGAPVLSANLDLARHMKDTSDSLQALQIANHRDPRCEDRYCAWLVAGLGKYGAYSFADSSLVVSPYEDFGFTEVHEMFHAVQVGYPGVLPAIQEDGAPIRWILEGTAEHVARAAARHLGMSAGGQLWLRTYDDQLHVPPTNSGSQYNAWAYGSREFFDFLGEYLASADGVRYIDHLLGVLGPGQKNGLAAVEAAIRAETGRSLYDAFPAFVARRLVYPCYFSHLGSWKDDDCAAGPDNEHRFELSYPDTVQRLDHLTSDLSANGYLVRMEVPAGRTGQLTIRVPPDQDEEYLHLVVDDEVRNEPGSESRRNEFTAVLPAGRHEFLVRLANVPRAVADVEEGNFDGAPVEFMLDESYATITSISISPGPSGADVDRPIGIRFDRGLGGIVTDAPGASARYPFDPGLRQPCWLIWDHLHKAQQDPIRGDGLSLHMVHEGPIGPGDYPLADGTEVVGMDPWPAGRPMVGFRLGFVNQLPAQQLQSFEGVAGTLTIESVSGRFVTGTLHVTGENSRADDIARGWEEPPPNYLPGAVIRVEFGLLMRDPADPVRHEALARCLAPEPPGGGASVADGGDKAGGPPGDRGRGSPTDSEGRTSDSAADPAGGAPGGSADPGEQGAEAAADPPAELPGGPANPASEQLGPGEARWVSVQADGRPDWSFSGSDVDGSAGAFFSCFGPASSVHLALTEGESPQDAELGLVVITDTGIAAGATGTYAIDEVVYQVGGEVLDWRGPVTLELSRHDAASDPAARRVAGRIVGLHVVDRQTDALIPVEAEFDVNAACVPPTDQLRGVRP